MLRKCVLSVCLTKQLVPLSVYAGLPKSVTHCVVHYYVVQDCVPVYGIIILSMWSNDIPIPTYSEVYNSWCTLHNYAVLTIVVMSQHYTHSSLPLRPGLSKLCTTINTCRHTYNKLTLAIQKGHCLDLV